MADYNKKNWALNRLKNVGMKATNPWETKPTHPGETKSMYPWETMPTYFASPPSGLIDSSSSKITGALGSDTRKAQYDRNNWKYDDTIKGYNRNGSKKSTPIATTKFKTSAVKTEPTGDAPVLRKATKPTSPQAKPTRSQKLRAKGEKALDEGKNLKARRVRKKYDKAVKRENR